jgi:hypothetical protein
MIEKDKRTVALSFYRVCIHNCNARTSVNWMRRLHDKDKIVILKRTCTVLKDTCLEWSGEGERERESATCCYVLN